MKVSYLIYFSLGKVGERKAVAVDVPSDVRTNHTAMRFQRSFLGMLEAGMWACA